MSWISTTPQRQTSTPRKHLRSPPLDILLVEEDFERLPKTDYTYAASGSYSPRKLGASYQKPNMSRPGLRKSYVFERSTFDQSELPDDSSVSNSDQVDLRLADLPSYTPINLNVNGPHNVNNSGRYSLDREAMELLNPSDRLTMSDRSATRSGTRYGLLWQKDDKRGRRRSNQKPPVPPQLPSAQKLQESNAHHESFIARSQPDLVNSRHSPERTSVTHHPEPDSLPVPHLYGLDDSDDSESENENHNDMFSRVPPQSSQSKSWLTIIIRTILTIVTITVTTVAGATKSLLTQSSSLVLSTGSESHSFISRVFHWIWSVVRGACYAILFVCYFLYSAVKLAVVKIVQILSAPLRLSTNLLYDLYDWGSTSLNDGEAERSMHWLRSGKDKPDGEESDDSEVLSGDRTSEARNEEYYHNESVTKKTTITELVSWTASLPLLAVRGPVEWYWKNVAGGDIEEDLPWLRSGRNRSNVTIVPRGRRRRKQVAKDSAGEDEELESEEEEETVMNHIETTERVEDSSSIASGILDVFHSIFRFLLLVVSVPVVLVLGPLVRVFRKLFGRTRKDNVAWLRSGRNRKQYLRAARTRQSGRMAGDNSASDSDEEVMEAEEEDFATEKTSLVTWITTTITTTVWTVTNTVTAPGRWVTSKLFGSEPLDESDSYKLDEVLRNKSDEVLTEKSDARRGSNSSESGYDSTGDADVELSDTEHTSVVTSVCSWLLYILMLPFTVLLAPFRLISSATETSEEPEIEEEEDVAETVHEEVSYVETSSTSKLRQRPGKKRLSVGFADTTVIEDDEETPGVLSRLCNGLLYVWYLLASPVTVPINWIRSKWGESSDDVDGDTQRTRRSAKRLSKYSRSDVTRTNYSERFTGGARSTCDWLIWILLLPFFIVAAPFIWAYRKLRDWNAWRSSASTWNKTSVSYEDEIIIEEAEDSEGSVMQSACGWLWFIVTLPFRLVAAPFVWIWSKVNEKPGMRTRSRKSFSTSVKDSLVEGTQKTGSFLWSVITWPFLMLAAPFIWVWDKVSEKSAQRTREGRSFSTSVKDSLVYGTQKTGSFLWFIVTWPFLMLAAPFIWMWRKINEKSAARTGRGRSFTASVKDSLVEGSQKTGSFLWSVITWPFWILAAPFIWIWRKVNEKRVKGSRGKSFTSSAKDSFVEGTQKTGSFLWTVITWPFLMLAAPFVWTWRKSQEWYSSSDASRSRRNAYKGAKSAGSSCCSWLSFILTLPFLILSAPFIWLWRKVSANAIKESVASGASSTAGLISSAASATGNGLWRLLTGTWWLICLPFTLTSQGVKKLASSEAAGAVAGLWSSDSRRRKGSGAGLCCCWCLPLLLVPLLAWLLYPDAIEKYTNITNVTTNKIVSPPVVVPVAVGSRDDDQTKMLLAALQQQKEKLDAESARIGGILAGMSEKDATIAALQAELAGLHAALASGQEENKGAIAGLAVDMKEKIAALQGEVDSQKALLAALMAQVKDCCKNDTALALWIADLVRQEMAGFVAGGGGDSSPQMKAWVQDGFVAKSDADAQMAALASKVEALVLAQAEKDRAAIIAASTDAATLAATAAATASATEAATDAATSAATIAATSAAKSAASAAASDAASSAAAGAIVQVSDEVAAKVTADVTKIAAAAARAEYQEMKAKEGKGTIAAGAAAIMGTLAGSGLSEERVRAMIKEALMLFAADRNNMPDYALESTGGSVISTRCSETYHRQTAQLSLFGIPLYYSSNSPRTVIQPDVHPGQCWAFKGNQGYVVIQLATLLKVESFTLEHIPKSLSPNGKIESAPRNFTVLGMEHEKDKEGKVLGRYVYEQSGEPMQYFIVQEQNLPPFPIVELRVESNWGNEQYTCLYRFRVHGKPVKA